jgi:hypothetical protein
MKKGKRKTTRIKMKKWEQKWCAENAKSASFRVRLCVCHLLISKWHTQRRTRKEADFAFSAHHFCSHFFIFILVVFLFPFFISFFWVFVFFGRPPPWRIGENEKNKYFSFLSFLEDPPLDELGKMKNISISPKPQSPQKITKSFKKKIYLEIV